MECDEWWGVGLVGLYKTVRGEVRVLAGDGAVKSRTSWGLVDVCKWVGEWDRGWWRKRRWEAGSLGGGGE